MSAPVDRPDSPRPGIASPIPLPSARTDGSAGADKARSPNEALKKCAVQRIRPLLALKLDPQSSR